MPYLSRILVYPLKSLDGVSVDQVQITAGGSLAFDRQWAMFDDQGQFINGKRTPLVHRLRCRFDLDAGTLRLGIDHLETDALTFGWPDDRASLETWLGDYFGFPVHLRQDLHQGFPDDTHASGPTLLSEQTLQTVAQWFPPMTLEAARWRFRANLEIAEVPPFWEDYLVGPEGTPIPFHIGTVQIWGINPCRRCIVPSRDPWTGVGDRTFPQRFMEQRRLTFPPGVVQSRFQNPYRLSLNTQIPASEAGKMLQVGQGVNLGDHSPGIVEFSQNGG